MIDILKSLRTDFSYLILLEPEVYRVCLVVRELEKGPRLSGANERLTTKPPIPGFNSLCPFPSPSS